MSRWLLRIERSSQPRRPPRNQRRENYSVSATVVVAAADVAETVDGGSGPNSAGRTVAEDGRTES